MIMIVNKQMRLNLFTTCVDFIGYDIYDRTECQHVGQLNFHTQPFSSAFSTPWPLSTLVYLSPSVYSSTYAHIQTD